MLCVPGYKAGGTGTTRVARVTTAQEKLKGTKNQKKTRTACMAVRAKIGVFKRVVARTRKLRSAQCDVWFQERRLALLFSFFFCFPVVRHLVILVFHFAAGAVIHHLRFLFHSVLLPRRPRSALAPSAVPQRQQMPTTSVRLSPSPPA